MDPKALAKAKRSHTQHGRKSHPTPAASAQKKKAAAQAGSSENVRRPHPQTLPSNWDRYGGGEEEDEPAGGTSMAAGETARKSRGADFAYLIEQARSQQHGSKAPAEAEPMSFFDELTLDFMQGVSSTFTVRGKNLLSRCEDDNFVVDDDLTPNFEVPFLNLDLHALAAQISKLKLSERLFIEEDILPEDLCSDDSKGVLSSLRSETLGVINATQNLDSLPRSSPAKDVILQTEDQSINLFPFANLSQIHSDQENVQGTGGDTEKSPGNLSKISPLKVGDAEAELDLLLESFRETDLTSSIQDLLRKAPASEISFPDSTQTNRNSNATGNGLLNQKQALETDLDSLLGPIRGSLVDRSSDFKPQNSNFYQKLSIQDQVFSKSTTGTSIDDSIDVLLSETSPILNIQTHSIAPNRQTGASRPPLYSGSSSVTDVRAHASASLVQKSAASLNELASSSKGHLSDLGSGDVIDDFDSWIDTL